MPTTTLNAAPSGTAVPTPGPWHIAQGDRSNSKVNADEAFSVRSSDWAIAAVWEDAGIDGEAEANARLIAAAPLMLEALKTLHDKTAELIAHLQSTDRLRPCFNLPAIETARSAIAAATGAQGGTR